MIPFHFGSSDSPLYGVFHPGAAPRKRKGVLVLNPWGWEALRVHRTLRTLADRLAASGVDVLRFDYSCSGDSMGSHDAASATRWLADARVAAEELQSMAAVERVGVVGLRLGALIAAELAADHPAVDRLVLWEPPSPDIDLLGWDGLGGQGGPFPVPAAFETEVAALSLRRLEKFRGHLMSIGSTPLAIDTASRSFHQILTEASDQKPWIEDRDHGAGAIPVQLLTELVEWLT